jgi:SulP family sulfate permease
VVANYFGLINIAGYVKYFPYPVVSGFMSGVGLIIILLQLFPFVGLNSKSTFAILEFAPTFRNLIFMRLLGILTVLIYLIPLLTKAIPSALALIIGALTSYFLGWDVPIMERFHLNSKFTD